MQINENDSEILMDEATRIFDGAAFSKKMVRLSLAVALLLPYSEAARAQFAVNCSQNLRFDTVAACVAGGAVTITPAATKISTTGCAHVLGTPQRAVCSAKSFATSGSLSVKVSATKVNVTGPASMQIDNFNIGTSAGGATKIYASTALTATPISFGVGGRMAIGALQSNGSYSGQVVMTVIFTP